MNDSIKLLVKVLLPVGIGIAVVGWLMARDFDIDTWRSISWSHTAIAGIALALLFTLGR